jgi:hypothetical protein
MDIFFQDPSEIPLPPDEIRIRRLQAEAWPDGRRIRVFLEVDPFQKPPNAYVFILDPNGEEVAQASIIESITRKMEFTLHLRRPADSGDYLLKAVLYYTEPIPDPQNEAEQAALKMPTSNEVDRKEFSFNISNQNKTA